MYFETLILSEYEKGEKVMFIRGITFKEIIKYKYLPWQSNLVSVFDATAIEYPEKRIIEFRNCANLTNEFRLNPFNEKGGILELSLLDGKIIHDVVIMEIFNSTENNKVIRVMVMEN